MTSFSLFSSWPKHLSARVSLRKCAACGLSVLFLFTWTACESREGLLEKPTAPKSGAQQSGETKAGHNSPLNQVENSELRGYYDHVDDPPFLYKAKEGEDVLFIRQDHFNTQISDIYYAFKRYKDKKIVIQGMYARLPIGDRSDVPTVYRRGQGCCGNDGWGGFLLELADGDKKGQEPETNAWVEVVGVPELKTHGLYYNLYLKVESMTVLPARGAEYVRS